MKIIFAVPIYPPEIGGPAIYSQKLKEGLEKTGHSVRVISYKGLRKFPQPLRIFIYFLKLFKITRDCDLIYAFSLVSCGLPAIFCRKKLAIRIGGDYLWERAAEAGKTAKSLKEYYEKLPAGFNVKMIKKVLNGADRLIFTSRFQKDIYLKYFGFKEEKTTIILNPFPEINLSNLSNYQSPVVNYRLLYAGRLIKLKNLSRLIDAFALVADKTKKPAILKIIGEGPERRNLELKIDKSGLKNKIIIEKTISHEELLKEIQKSYLCVLPSFTEITPNFALECLKLGRPILLTRETGFYEIFKDDLMFINPFNVEDIRDKIEFLLDENNWIRYSQKISQINRSRAWQEVLRDHLEVFKNI